MEVAYYNLSGGINQASTKTDLGLNTKKVYWADGENVEILQNKGIIKQLGNTPFLELPVEEEITGMHEMSVQDVPKLIITTISGKIYIYNSYTNALTLLEKTLTGTKPFFANFLNGLLVNTEKDAMFYIKDNPTYDVVECGLNDVDGNLVKGGVITVFRGRVWVAKDSTVYYSALGTYDDFTTEADAGYIRDFHTDTSNIIALKPYKDYLAIYKYDMVYLLTGVNYADFAVVPFANKGCVSPRAIVNVDNKQYFLSNGIYALEQIGELNQIQLGSEISNNIRKEFDRFDETRLHNTLCLHYEDKHQMWYFFPYSADDFYHTVWINDYVNKAWFKRVIPQNIVQACIFYKDVLTADNKGKIYREDYGTTFSGLPVRFMWKSPFFSLGDAYHRKMIDEFYFILDENYDNDFNFSVYKDYDSEFSDDIERIYSVHLEHFIWADDNTDEALPCHWPSDEENTPIWAINRETIEKAEISEANYAIQLCVSGENAIQSCAIIGLQFREIYNDD